tara:strand:+ start:902 stop:1036 length:135 start_codon:yes stop_codon:yes gene_type:complete
MFLRNPIGGDRNDTFSKRMALDYQVAHRQQVKQGDDVRECEALS